VINKAIPFPEEKDKQLKDQPEFIDPKSNKSKNKKLIIIP
jgi:hypothetical protein